MTFVVDTCRLSELEIQCTLITWENEKEKAQGRSIAFLVENAIQGEIASSVINIE